MIIPTGASCLLKIKATRARKALRTVPQAA
jgi:hypothetical protein